MENTPTQRARRAHILSAALAAAERHGYTRMTLQQVADAAEVSKQLPLVYFGTMAQLRRQVMRAAVRTGNLRVVAQGLAMRDAHALKAPQDLRAQAASALVCN